jgi:hypothetical protein
VGVSRTQEALLVSGGIGDFLHYIVRFSSFLEHCSCPPEGLTVFVEATQPRQVERLFKTCLPEVDCHFIPPSLHWTKSNPLLNWNRDYDRTNRCAYQYVLSKGAKIVEDWFLPSFCGDYSVRVDRLEVLRGAAVPQAGPSVFVSTRDKGFLWWPSIDASIVIERYVTRSFNVMYFGTENERLPWLRSYTVASDVFEGLTLSCKCNLFIGTDTGFATAREFLRMPNIYCINRYWYDELMIGHKYWTKEMADATTSHFAFDLPGLETALASFFGSRGHTLAPCGQGHDAERGSR